MGFLYYHVYLISLQIALIFLDALFRCLVTLHVRFAVKIEEQYQVHENIAILKVPYEPFIIILHVAINKGVSDG